MGQLDKKVVVITGGNQGIGKGIARLFGSEGARLALCAATRPSSRQRPRSCNRSVTTFCNNKPT